MPLVCPGSENMYSFRSRNIKTDFITSTVDAPVEGRVLKGCTYIIFLKRHKGVSNRVSALSPTSSSCY